MSTDYVPAKLKSPPKAPRMYENAADLMAETKVRDIMVGFSKLMDVNADDSVLVAFKKISEGRILSLPVFDQRRQKYIGFVDVVDIVHYFLKSLTEAEAAKGFSAFKERFSKTKCKDVMDISGRNPYNPVQDDVPLNATISMMTDSAVHRLPVVDGGGELVSLLSQSRVVSFLTENLLKFPDGVKTLEELKLGIRNVVCVQETDLTVTAFDTMRTKKVSSVGVLNPAGELVGVLSVTDLRSVGLDDQLFQRLYMPVGQFIAAALSLNPNKPKKPITVTVKHTLTEVLDIVAKTGIHRLYITDDASKPIGIIALGDIIGIFAK